MAPEGQGSWRSWLCSIDFVLTVMMVIVLLCVIDAGIHMPHLGRPLQLVAATLLMAFGGCAFALCMRPTLLSAREKDSHTHAAASILGWSDLFAYSTQALPSMGMVLPGADPRRKPLTTEGGFGLCRHPQYAGLIALCLSICLLSQSADRLFYTLWLMLVLDKKADLEEQRLSEEHPEYSTYLLRVPKFIPNVFLGLNNPTRNHAARASGGGSATARDSEQERLLVPESE